MQVSNILGALPAQFFQVTVSSTAESLAQLMYSVLLTGYLFRNAYYRMQLRNALLAGESVAAGMATVLKLLWLVVCSESMALLLVCAEPWPTAMGYVQVPLQQVSRRRLPTTQRHRRLHRTQKSMPLVHSSFVWRARFSGGMFAMTQRRGYQRHCILRCSSARSQC